MTIVEQRSDIPAIDVNEIVPPNPKVNIAISTPEDPEDASHRRFRESVLMWFALVCIAGFIGLGVYLLFSDNSDYVGIGSGFLTTILGAAIGFIAGKKS
ncbi:MAG: hypothetical protein Q6M04_09465 [Thermostichus sp. BF3_bins_97]